MNAVTLKRLDVVAAIIERDGKILLAQRGCHQDQSGLWEFPGGKVEMGESQPAALYRELQEELAIQCHVISYVATSKICLAQREIHLHAWRVQILNNEPSAHEHAALHWVTPQHAMKYSLTPADVPLLNAYLALLENTHDLG